MKIDCPHCGVHGSVDDSIAGKKLRCPKCSKVFLLTEEVLPEVDDTGMMRQEILHDDGQQAPDSVAQGIMATGTDESVEPEDEIPGETVEESEEVVDIEGVDDIPSESEEELLGSKEEDLPDEEILDEEVLDLMDDEGEEEEPAELEKCSGCGESLNPEFLETVGSERLCALCLPETEEEEIPEDSLTEDAEPVEEEADSVETLTDEEEVAEEDSATEVCSVCGEKFHPDFLQEIDSKLYCGICQPEVVEDVTEGEVIAAGAAATVATTAVVSAMDSETQESEESDEEELQESAPDFTVGELIKEAWQKTKGAKASVWGGLIVMYLLLFGISLGAWYAFQGSIAPPDPTTSMGLNVGVQVVTSWLSVLLTAGMMLIGVRRALEQRVSWKMVFAGFSKALSITVAMILQTILIVIGFALLVLPGIYLSVGYGLALPLILEKGMGPWEALEASRKAIHKKWWTVFGMYLVMLLIYMVSVVPLGLGLIWTIPMFFVLIGVLYVRLFAADVIAEEEPEYEEETEEQEELEEVSEENKQA